MSAHQTGSNMLRIGTVIIGLAAFAMPALAQESDTRAIDNNAQVVDADPDRPLMNASEARRFVVGKTFSYTCFEGTKGKGLVNDDGSVAGTIQFQGSGPTRYAVLPANTLHVKGEMICASLKGMPFQPCFNLQKTGKDSFRGSLSGLSFAGCEFKRDRGRPAFANAIVQP